MDTLLHLLPLLPCIPLEWGILRLGSGEGGKKKRGRKVKVRNESRFAMEIKVVLNYW